MSPWVCDVSQAGARFKRWKPRRQFTTCRLLRLTLGWRHHDLQHEIDIPSGRARFCTGNATPLEPQFEPCVGACGDFQFNRTAGRGDFNLGTQSGLPQCHRQAKINVMLLNAVMRMGPKPHFQIQITCCAFASARRALPGQAIALPGLHTARNDKFDLVLAVPSPDATATATHAACPAAAPKQRLKKITLLLGLGIGTATPGRLKPLIRARWCMEFLPRLEVGPDLVIGRTRLRVREHLASFAHVLEPGLSIGLLADIGVVFTGQFAVRTLDVLRGGICAPPPSPCSNLCIPDEKSGGPSKGGSHCRFYFTWYAREVECFTLAIYFATAIGDD